MKYREGSHRRNTENTEGELERQEKGDRVI